MEVLYNACYGGFSFSLEFLEHLHQCGLATKDEEGYLDCPQYAFDVIGNSRTNPLVIKAFKEFKGERASGEYAKILIQTIPEGASYYIDEYDGYESVIPIITVTKEELAKGLSPQKLILVDRIKTIHIQD